MTPPGPAGSAGATGTRTSVAGGELSPLKLSAAMKPTPMTPAAPSTASAARGFRLGEFAKGAACVIRVLQVCWEGYTGGAMMVPDEAKLPQFRLFASMV